MDDRLEKLKKIKIENYIWIIYIGIIILSWYANYKEKNYFLYNDQKSKKEYQNLLILIFGILLIVYFYFAKDSFNDIKELNIYDSIKKKKLTYASFIGSSLILISGFIFLIIAILDEDIEVELAFN